MSAFVCDYVYIREHIYEGKIPIKLCVCVVNSRFIAILPAKLPLDKQN